MNAQWLSSVLHDDPVIVIAGGWSCSQYKRVKSLIKYGHVIGVNDAAVHAEVHTAVTMDREWLENRIDVMDEYMLPTWYRECTAKNVKPGPLHHSYKGNIKPLEMSQDCAELWGDNSGAVALNLAYLMRPKKCYLFGYDMQKGPSGESHWYKPYQWKNGGGSKPSALANWARGFNVKAAQFEKAGIKVYNVNPRSLITAFQTMSFADFEKEFE